MIMIRTSGMTATVTTDRVRTGTGDDISIVTTIIGTATGILTGDATRTRRIRTVTGTRTRTEEAMVVTATMVTMVAIAVMATAVTTTITRSSWIVVTRMV